MQYKFTSKNMGRFLRIAPILLVVLCLFAGTTSAQCTWTASTVYPTTVLDVPTVSVGTNLYAFGGVANGVTVAVSNKFDGTAWTAIAPLPQALEFPSAVSDGTNIYVMGGASIAGIPQTTNYRYNIATNTYTTMAPFTTGTWNHAAVFLNGKIYKFAGSAATAATTALEIYDIASNTWSSGAAYPAATSFVSAAVINGFIYTAGGINNNAGTTKTYRYDPTANTWDDAAIADLPATRWGAASTIYRNGFVLAGGYVGGDVTANISTSVISLDPTLNTWTSLPNLLAERSRMSGTILNDAFYVVGGRSIASAAFLGTNNNQKLTCPPILPCAGTPAPGNTFASSTAVCTGTSVSFSIQNATAGSGVTYQWQTAPDAAGPWTNATGTSTNASYTATVTTTTFYRVLITCASNTSTTASTPVQVSASPCTCLTPDVATICEGVIQRLSVTGAGTAGASSATSGPIAVAVPDANAAGITSSIPVTLPAGASITSMSVNFTLTHTWDADMVFNLVAPDGKILNLVNSRGGSGDNFTNTTISSTSTTSLATGAAPFNGTFAADAVLAVGPTAFQSNVATFSGLYATPTGTWRLAMRDQAFGDVGLLTSWSLSFNYNILPTATWTGGTIFSDANATIPYVAGTQTNAVWVQPSVNTVYTANISSGPCAGPNNVTVTVLPRPVVTVNPATGCGPLTITASGAASYAWTPATGLNTATGPTVIANPTSTTTYTVTGTGANGCVGLPVSAVVNSAPTASVIAPVAGATYQINEVFDGTTQPPAGWAQQNLSVPIGTTAWFKPTSPAPFPAFSGTETSYIAANYNNGAGTATISNWLFSPVVTIKNGDFITFYTRTTDGAFPDRLQLRLSTSGNSVNVGTTATSTGDFGTLLVDVNPNLTTSGYPTTWTQFTGTVSGVTGTVTGRFAFRYFVTNGGTAGANSDFIGLDNVQYATPASVNCANVVTNLAVNITGGVGPYTVVYNNGTTNTTINNYTSGSNIQVAPSVTTTYTIVSVTGANGCVGTGNSGAATITITPPPSITTQPAATSVCAGNNATISVTAGPVLGNNYQWQVSTNGGTTYTNLTNTAPYSGVTTSTLTITGATTALNNNRYRVVITGSCGAPVTSAGAILTVNTPAIITTQPASTSVCATPSTAGTSATFTVAATGGNLTYQWQVSTDGGTTFTNVANGANYAGATTATLTVAGVGTSFNNYVYRVLVTTGGCTAVTSGTAILTIKPATVVVISASPSEAIFPSMTATLTAAVSPVAATSYTWFKDGVVVPGATTNTLTGITVDQIGTYTVSVLDANGCGGVSNAVTIRDSATTTLFIYPNPSNGQFHVRYYDDPTNNGYFGNRTITIYDSKGARVYKNVYVATSSYTDMFIDMSNHARGIYSVDVTDSRGNRLKTGRILIQ